MAALIPVLVLQCTDTDTDRYRQIIQVQINGKSAR